MKIIDILQKILHEQKVEPAAQDVTATKYTEPDKPKIGLKLQDFPEKSNINKDNINEVISCSGYAEGTPEFKFAKIIATKEGWVKNLNNGQGSRSYRNNNPGNLDYYDGLKSIDSNVTREKKLDGSEGRYAKFSDPCLGSKALIDGKIIRWSKGGMPNNGAPGYKAGAIPTLAQFIYTFAPPSENDTTKYINDVLKSLDNVQFTPDTSMAKIIKI